MLSNGFKSRPGNCPYASVVLGSGAMATWGRENAQAVTQVNL